MQEMDWHRRVKIIHRNPRSHGEALFTRHDRFDRNCHGGGNIEQRYKVLLVIHPNEYADWSTTAMRGVIMLIILMWDFLPVRAAVSMAGTDSNGL